MEECLKWRINKEGEMRMKKKRGMEDGKDKNWVKNEV